MNSLAAMIESHPAETSEELLLACLTACWECAQTCTVCADACLSEEGVAELRDCIRSDLNCADICRATAAILSRRGGGEPAVVRALVQACALACESCGRECDRHAEHHEHCRICAEACHRCARACRELIAAMD